MTPEQIEEFNRRTKGDPMAMATELVKVINEHEAEIQRLTDERDEARKVAAALLLGIELHVGFDAIKTLNIAELPAWATPWLAAERARAAVDGTR